MAIRLLERTDYVLMGIGTLALIALVGRWWQGGRRDPLRGSPIRVNRLTPVWLWVAFFGQFVGMLVGAWLVSLVGPARGPDDPLDPGMTLLATNLAQVVTAFACLAVAQVTFAAGWRGLGFDRRGVGKDVGWAVVAWLAQMGPCTLVLLATLWMIEVLFPDVLPSDHSVLEALRAEETARWLRWLAVIGALVLAPISEELFFRGILQSGIKKLVSPRPGSMRHRWIAIVVVALIFGGMHMGVPQSVPALVVFGLILGYVYERRGSLLAPILLHMLFNGKTLLWEYIRQAAT